MTSNAPIAIDCELDSLEEPIRGRLRNRGGREAEFSGWIEFSAVLIDLAEEAHASTAETPEEGHE